MRLHADRAAMVGLGSHDTLDAHQRAAAGVERCRLVALALVALDGHGGGIVISGGECGGPLEMAYGIVEPVRRLIPRKRLSRGA